MRQNFRVVPFLRSNYRTASLRASVGSPPGRAVCGHILADAEPFSASVSRSIDKSVRLRKFPLRWLTFCLLEARPFPPLPPCTPACFLCTGVDMWS